MDKSSDRIELESRDKRPARRSYDPPAIVELGKLPELTAGASPQGGTDAQNFLSA